MWPILKNKKNLTFLGVAILILTILLIAVFMSLNYLLSAALSAIGTSPTASSTEERFNLPKP